MFYAVVCPLYHSKVFSNTLLYRHCDGPASTAVSSGTSRASEVEVSTTSADASPTLPSPTESVGCEPHGDHWHCDGPAETAGASSSATVSASPTMPIPTESSGCEPHGDHWHCDGPAETGSASASASASASTSSGDEGGAGAIGVQISLLVGLSLVAAGLNL